MVSCNDITELGRAGYVRYVILGTASASCPCQIFVHLQVSHFGYLGKCVNKLCFFFSAFDGRVSGRGGFGGSSLLSLPEDVDLGSTKYSVYFLNHSGTFCARFHDARVVSRSSGVNSLVVSADFSAELEGCASLDTSRTTISTKLSHLQGEMLPLWIRFGFWITFQLYEYPNFFAEFSQI